MLIRPLRSPSIGAETSDWSVVMRAGGDASDYTEYDSELKFNLSCFISGGLDLDSAY